jgi:hypothetical protein
MLEAFIQKKIKKWFQKHGWTVVRLRATDPPSMPDLMVLRKGVIKFVEVKQPGKNPTPLQQRMIEKLRGEGFEVYVMDSVPVQSKIGLQTIMVRENVYETIPMRVKTNWDDWFPNLSSSGNKIKKPTKPSKKLPFK